MAQHNVLGREGELAAANYLKANGYEIVACNWRHHTFEIDIIARNEEYIVFVEVKTRKSDKWGHPEEAVTDNKIKRIVNAADFYIEEHDIEQDARFDIISIIKRNDDFELKHFVDAFLAPLN